MAKKIEYHKSPLCRKTNKKKEAKTKHQRFLNTQMFTIYLRIH